MATLTPTLTLTSAAGDAFSDEFNVSVTDSLAVTGQTEHSKIVSVGTSGTTFIPAADYTKAYVYIKNTSGSAALTILLGSAEMLSMATSEWTFFPWYGNADIKYKQTAGQAFEFAVFEA